MKDGGGRRPRCQRDARFVPTIVMRRTGGVLQRDGNQGLILRRVAVAETNAAKRVHCEGRGRAVRSSLLKAMEVRGWVPETGTPSYACRNLSTGINLVFIRTTPRRKKEQSQVICATCPISSTPRVPCCARRVRYRYSPFAERLHRAHHQYLHSPQSTHVSRDNILVFDY